MGGVNTWWQRNASVSISNSTSSCIAQSLFFTRKTNCTNSIFDADTTAGQKIGSRNLV